MINIDKLFKAAKKAGIAEFEARITENSKLSVAMFDNELENYTVADECTLKVRGLYNGKSGVFTSDRVDDEVIDTAITALKESAEYGNPLDPELFVDGGKYKYEKVDTYHAALENVGAETFIDIAKQIAANTLKKDKRVEHANIELEYDNVSQRIVNSKGLDVSSKSNYAIVYANIKATDGKDVQSGSHYDIITDIAKFDVNAFVNKLVGDTVAQLGGKSVDTGKYSIVYSPDCVAVLVRSLLDGFSAFNAEKHISLIEGKLGKQVFSPLFNVEQTPIGDDVFCSAFDDEGVPCRNMMLIEKGVPTGYVYDLESAKKASVNSTGNGKLNGGNIRPSVEYATVHGGDKSQAELFEFIGNGLYITELGGVHAGLDKQSGNYSLQASGYVIKNGKRDRAVSLITVAGNILTDFADITAVGNDLKLTYYAIKAPSVAVKEISVSGIKE